ncbi:MAG: anti-sigma factor family protein [Bdellovibrionia bacterium]
MTCFELQRYSSDFLDNQLQESLKKEAQKHVHRCKACSERLSRTQLILKHLAAQPQRSLPEEMRRLPVFTQFSAEEASRWGAYSWRRIPWYFRTGIQALGVVGGVLLLISWVPQLKGLYEKSIEHHLSDFRGTLNVQEASSDGFDGSIRDSQGFEAAANSKRTPSEKGTLEEDTDEIQGEDDFDSEGPSPRALQVGNSQLWRFTIQTVSPDELRPQIAQVLAELKLSSSSANLKGTQVPGGIEFEMIVPLALVSNIKQSLEKIVAKMSQAPEETVDSSRIFSWYKVKSRKKLPTGMSKVVIWISQPN